MIRKFVTALAGAAVAASAFVSPGRAAGVDPALVDRLVAGCTAQGMFGQRFGEAGEAGHARLTDEWAPFVSLDLSRTRRTTRLFEIDALASFEDEPGTSATRRAQAAELAAALDARARADDRFVSREVSDGENIVFASSTDEAQGYNFEVMQMGVGVYVSCTDRAGYKSAFAEAFGDVRLAERPTPPTLPLPPKPAANACAAPESRRALVASYLETGMQVLDYANAASRYSENLAAWKGQQMVDKQVWTKAQKDQFALSAISDPVISRELQANLARLMPMLESIMAFSAANDAHDEARACAEALKGFDAIYAIVASNEVQWRRMLERYDAEAKRKGVTLD